MLTAKFIKRNARVDFDELDQPLVDYEFSRDGQMVFASLKNRISDPQGGLPLAMFLDGTPVRGRDGNVIAPRLRSEITKEAQITDLKGVDVADLVILLNSGKLQ